MNTLLSMLTYRRPHGSITEREFIDRFIAPIPGISTDQVGNYYLKLGSSTTAFSCHVDTMHAEEGIQRVCVAYTSGIAYADDSSCLGADNAVGVWLLLELIKANVPGLYLFHRGEECGGIGSKHIVTLTPHLVDGIERMVAFDRKGDTDVITHQSGVQTASMVFAEALASHLGGNYTPSSEGVYTDTLEYEHLINDCTNVSCGYNFEHTPDEYVVLHTVEQLRDKILMIPWDELPTGARAAKIPSMLQHSYDVGYDSELPRMTYDALVKYIQNNACEIADLLIDEGLA